MAKTLGKTDKLTEKLAEKIEWKSVKTKLPKGNRPGLILKPTDSYKIQRGKTSQNLANTVKKSGEKITKLAKSKGGKVGLATAGALGALGAITIKNKKNVNTKK